MSGWTAVRVFWMLLALPGLLVAEADEASQPLASEPAILYVEPQSPTGASLPTPAASLLLFSEEPADSRRVFIAGEAPQRLEVAPGSSWRLAHEDGWWAPEREITVGGPGSETFLPVPLWPTAPVTGLLAGGSGRELPAGVTIEFELPRERPAAVHCPVEESGRFRCDLPEGRLDLRVSAASLSARYLLGLELSQYHSLGLLRIPAAPPTPVDRAVAVAPRRTVRGRAFVGGLPTPGTWVSLVLAGSGARLTSETGPGGMFELEVPRDERTGYLVLHYAGASLRAVPVDLRSPDLGTLEVAGERGAIEIHGSWSIREFAEQDLELRLEQDGSPLSADDLLTWVEQPRVFFGGPAGARLVAMAPGRYRACVGPRSWSGRVGPLPAESCVTGDLDPDGRLVLALPPRRWLRPEPPKELLEHVVWEGERPQVPIFLPAAVLERHGPSGIGMDEERRRRLEQHLEFLRRREPSQAQSIPCSLVSESGISEVPNDVGRTVVEALETSGFAALGRVLARVPGWGPDRAVTMVYVEIEELLHCGEYFTGLPLAPGDVVGVTEEQGSFELEGVRVCNDTASALTIPPPGERVIVAGNREHDDPYFAGHRAILLPVEAGRVLPQPYSSIRWEPMPYQDLMQMLGGPVSQCRAARPGS